MLTFRKSNKLCTVLFATLMTLPFTSNADDTEVADTRTEEAFEYFDKDGDGMLNKSEKALAHRAHNVIDYNDGEIEPREANRAKRFHGAVDYNEDRKVSRKEYKWAGKIHNAADKNDDGKIGPGEYKHAKKKHDRIDVNDDSKASKREYKHHKQHHHQPQFRQRTKYRLYHRQEH